MTSRAFAYLSREIHLKHLGVTGLLVAAAICVLVSGLAARGRQGIRKIAEFPEPPVAERNATLIDVSKQETALIEQWLSSEQNFHFTLWDERLGKASSDLSLPEPDSKWPRDIKFQGNGSTLVIFSPPILRLFDVQRNTEIRHVLPNRSYLDPSVLRVVTSYVGGPPVTAMAVNQSDGSVAVVFNIYGDIRLFLYDSTLEKQVATWTFPRYVQDIAWSQKGDKLAVLFNGRFEGTGPLPATHLDELKQFIEGHPPPTSGPDVWIVDPNSGEPSVKFKTGTQQSQIAFSPDGRLIYVIQDHHYAYPPGKGVIGVYSATSGELVRTLKAGPRGVSDYFSVSPEGRMIAANASSDPWHPIWTEPHYSLRIPRVVLLDTQTGKLLFERHESESWRYEHFAFSPDGRRLYLTLPDSKNVRHSRIEVYSLDISETGSPGPN